MLTIYDLSLILIFGMFALIGIWLLFGVILFLIYKLKGGKKRFLKFYRMYIDLL